MPDPTRAPFPVRVEADYPEHPSRLLAGLGLLFFLPKVILLVPHIAVMWFLGIAALVVMIAGYAAVLFTGSYPRGLYEFLLGTVRWQTRMNAWLYGLTDVYPPFKLEP
jgi:hypothetical protein